MARQAQGLTIPLEFTALIAFRGRVDSLRG